MKKVIDFFKSNIRFIILIIVILAFFGYYLNKDTLKKKTTYTVVEGTIEKSVESNLYILKNETLVDYDKNMPVTAIIDQGKKTAKNQAIATYKTESYDNYIQQIEEIDKQIQTLINDLPITYSADITSIENKILQYSNEIQKNTSYLKMQEYKTKLDELAHKKITIIANTTPDSSAIRDLINKREELVNLSKQSSNIIWTPTSGLVTYKIDGLEDKYEFNKIQEYDINSINKIIADYDMTTNSKFGIKIVDNYNAYLLVKTAKSSNDEFIKEGYNYKIRISDIENNYVMAKLIKNMQDSEYNYSIFSITNNIDNLIDFRKLSCEVIWKSYTGIAIPANAMYTENNVNYVVMVYGADYVKVPVNIIDSSDSIYIVENYDSNEVEKMGFDSRFKLELYDELIIE